MRITLAILVVASLFVTCQPAFAKVTATTIRLYMQTLDPSKLTYKVPSGSVFILQHVGFSTSWTPQARVIHIVPPGGKEYSSTVELTFTKSFNTLTRDLKLPAGTTIASLNAMTEEECILFGVLAEESDIYAAIGGELSAPSLAGGHFSTNLLLESPRPAVVTAQSTSQLYQANWREEPDAVTPTADRRVYRVEVPAGAEQSKFVRVTSRARENED